MKILHFHFVKVICVISSLHCVLYNAYIDIYFKQKHFKTIFIHNMYKYKLYFIIFIYMFIYIMLLVVELKLNCDA